MPGLLEAQARLDGELRPPSRCATMMTSGAPRCRVDEHVGALGDAGGLARARCGRRSAGSGGSGTRPAGRPRAQDRRPTPERSRWRRPGGRRPGPGIARSAARCSIGWWVGPSSPRPIESCVHTKVTGSLLDRPPGAPPAACSRRRRGRCRRRGGSVPASAMPLRIMPMACSRMPKCRVRPYGPPFHSWVCLPVGMNDGSPSIVVLLRLGEVGGAAPQLGQHAGQGGEHLAGGRAGRQSLRVGGEDRQGLLEPLGQAGLDEAVEQRGALGVGLAPRGVALVPRLVGGLAALLRPRGRGRGRPRRPRRSSSGRSRAAPWSRRPRRRRGPSRATCRCSAWSAPARR